jgi:hypothetical protein
MVYGRRNYLAHIPVAIWLGVALVEGVPLAIVGSEEVVLRYSLAYLRLEPGDVSVEEAPAIVKDELSRLLPGDQRVAAMALLDEEIQLRLPGRCRIVGRGRGEGKGDELSGLLESWS